MTWDNEAALNDLLAEAEGLGDGYVTVARVLPNRREEQLASREVGRIDELAAAVELAATTLPPGTRVRVRLWRRGGKPVRSVVLAVLRASTAASTVVRPTAASPVRARPDPDAAAPQPSPSIEAAPPSCPSCANLLEAIDAQNDRLDEISDEREAAEAEVRRLRRELAELREELDSASLRLQTAERERENVAQLLRQAGHRADAHADRLTTLKRKNANLRHHVEQAELLVALVNSLDVA